MPTIWMGRRGVIVEVTADAGFRPGIQTAHFAVDLDAKVNSPTASEKLCGYQHQNERQFEHYDPNLNQRLVIVSVS